MDTRYEILESLPTYGPMYIPVTGDDEPYYSQGFAVRFYRDDKSDWVANFKPGWTGLIKEIKKLEDGRYDLIIMMDKKDKTMTCSKNYNDNIKDLLKI